MADITEITWKIALRPLWAHFWRGLLIGLGLNLVLRLIFGVLAPDYVAYYAAHHHQSPALAIIGGLAGIGINFAMVGIVFQRDYEKFTITPRDNATGQLIELTPARTLRLWWSLIWRQLLIILAATIAVGLVVGLVVVALIMLHLNAYTKLLGLFIMPFFLVGGVFISLKVYAVVLKKRYRDFHMAVIAREQA